MYLESRTCDNRSSFVERHDMPAQRIYGRLMTTVFCELLSSDRPVAEVDPPAQALKIAEHPVVEIWLESHVLERRVQEVGRRRKNYLLPPRLLNSC
jgi:hypothetical protein